MNKGIVTAVCVGTERGKGKTRVDEGTLVAGSGLAGDGHARGGSRQVSVLSREVVDEINATKGTGAQPGDFAENILSQGLDFSKISVGDKLRLGDALVRITEIGKPEHGPDDFNFKGMAPLAAIGLFAEILVGGVVKEGDTITQENEE